MGERIAIIGTGHVAASLAPAWITAGHELVFGARDLESPTARALRERLGEKIQIQAVADAIAASRIVVLAVTGSAVSRLAAEHAAGLAGRIIVDATNYVARVDEGQAPEQPRALNSAEAVRNTIPSAHVFRAFNHYGWEVFASPEFDGRAAALFYCGPDDETAEVVEDLIADVGLDPVRVGDLELVGTVDSLITLWAALAIRNNLGRNNVGFALLRR